MLISFWLIYFSFSQEVNLVRDDYYQAEIQFDDKLESIKRTEKLDEKLLISLEAKNIKLVFPSNFINNDVNGSVFLYRPSNRESDIQFPIKLDSTNIQFIATTGMLNGMWKIQVSWSADSLEYFSEKNIMVE